MASEGPHSTPEQVRGELARRYREHGFRRAWTYLQVRRLLMSDQRKKGMAFALATFALLCCTFGLLHMGLGLAEVFAGPIASRGSESYRGLEPGTAATLRGMWHVVDGLALLVAARIYAAAWADSIPAGRAEPWGRLARTSAMTHRGRWLWTFLLIALPLLSYRIGYVYWRADPTLLLEQLQSRVATMAANCAVALLFAFVLVKPEGWRERLRAKLVAAGTSP